MSALQGLSKVAKDIGRDLPVDRLRDEAKNALGAAGDKAVKTAGDKVKDATGSLNDVTDGGGVIGRAGAEGAKAAAEGESPVKGALAGGLKGAKDKVVSTFTGGGSDPSHSVNIIESVDVAVPLSVAYNQWTQFHEQPDYMRKVENVNANEDNEIEYHAKIFMSKRSWTATIIEQVPDQHIVWRSEGEKGHVDGTISFHELAPRLTKVIVVLEYYPGGFFEKTANLWRAQGRRARSDLRHFARHVQTRTILAPDEAEGWRGEIRDEEVVRTPEEVAEDEQAEQDEQDEQGEGGEAPEDFDEAPEDEQPDETEEEPVDEEAPAEAEDFEEEAPADEEDFDEEAPADEEEYEEVPPDEEEYVDETDEEAEARR